jgi:ubiquinol-cytochrome c reductase cytochrome c1 subunit
LSASSSPSRCSGRSGWARSRHPRSRTGHGGQEFHLAPHEPEPGFSFNGPFGKFDRAQLQRGFQVYKEVCSNCHSLHFVAFRDLAALGYSEAEVKAIAKDWSNKAKVFDPKTGETRARQRAGRSLPDGLLRRHRQSAGPLADHQGPPRRPRIRLFAADRLSGPAAELLKKFPDSKTPDGLFYNPYFANLNIAMPPRWPTTR